MGTNFRKSVKLPGGVRVNFSKSGVGLSWGVKGFRVTQRADGSVEKTTSIPGTGIYCRETVSKPRATTEYAATPKTDPDAQQESLEPINKSMTEEKPFPYEHLSFLVNGNTTKNADGSSPQEILYCYKMRKPPYDTPESRATVSLEQDEETRKEITISIDGHLIASVPKKHVQYINDNWDRIDRISAFEVSGRKGSYQATVYLRFFKPGIHPNEEEQ